MMKRSVRMVGRLAVVLLGIWLCACVVLAAVIHHAGSRDAPVRSDVIVVLGAALTREGKPYRALSRRSEHAAQLWKDAQAGVIICTGGIGRDVHVPRSEADGCREVLMREGVPRAKIILEETSRNTEENARNARTIMEEHGWHSAILVTDSYHAFRARRVFGRMGVAVASSPVAVARIGSPLFYVYSVVREVGALHRQVLK